MRLLLFLVPATGSVYCTHGSRRVASRSAIAILHTSGLEAFCHIETSRTLGLYAINVVLGNRKGHHV